MCYFVLDYLYLSISVLDVYFTARYNVEIDIYVVAFFLIFIFSVILEILLSDVSYY